MSKKSQFKKSLDGDIGALEKGIKGLFKHLLGKRAMIHYKHEIRVATKVLKAGLVIAAIVVLTPIPDLELLLAPGLMKIFNISMASAFIVLKAIAVLILFLFAKNKLKKIWSKIKKWFK